MTCAPKIVLSFTLENGKLFDNSASIKFALSAESETVFFSKDVNLQSRSQRRAGTNNGNDVQPGRSRDSGEKDQMNEPEREAQRGR